MGWIKSSNDPNPLFLFLDLQICGFLKDGATEVWNSAQDVPYAYKGNQWVGYDNIKSFGIKVSLVQNSIT